MSQPALDNTNHIGYMAQRDGCAGGSRFACGLRFTVGTPGGSGWPQFTGARIAVPPQALPSGTAQNPGVCPRGRRKGSEPAPPPPRTAGPNRCRGCEPPVIRTPSRKAKPVRFRQTQCRPCPSTRTRSPRPRAAAPAHPAASPRRALCRARHPRASRIDIGIVAGRLDHFHAFGQQRAKAGAAFEHRIPAARLFVA